jgi:hypothetical protein
MERLLREKIRRRLVARLFNAADKLAAFDTPALFDTEIELKSEQP